MEHCVIILWCKQGDDKHSAKLKEGKAASFFLRRKLSPDKAIILDQATKFSEFARVYILSDIRYPQHVSREIEVVSIRAWSAQTGNLSQAKIRPEREKKKKMAYNQKLIFVKIRPWYRGWSPSLWISLP